jgi:hypothetical protein
MRQVLMGAALVIGALGVTFAAASILQDMAPSKRTIVAEPVAVEQLAPSATRASRNEPGGRSLLLVGKRLDL